MIGSAAAGFIIASVGTGRLRHPVVDDGGRHDLGHRRCATRNLARGAPVAGWVANHLGPRWALGVGAASGFAAALVAVVFLLQMTRQSLPDGGAGEARAWLRVPAVTAIAIAIAARPHRRMCGFEARLEQQRRA
ncbi:hypothetical protein BamIOP4010DRAFT_5239 [Burkholderia ambifaria IOP40-10]|uniref:Uncharacterized protein n=1 Tax=Burkholderia ambifaria IOP40-10 TaxID=396596 RepID=B1FMH8_9BURK|nr:hypothetical protein BamIOP4010DRAFT_5239 [Burkholderia ambifaria IOP40-10]